jgi:hypothetical protein
MSQDVRMVVTVQMWIGLFLVVFVLATMISRLDLVKRLRKPQR